MFLNITSYGTTITELLSVGYAYSVCQVWFYCRRPTPEENCIKMSMEYPDSLVKVTNLNKAVLQQSSAKPITSASMWVPIERA